MPKEMEMTLKREAMKKGLTGKRAGVYIYGAMRKAGWKPAREKHIREMAVKMMMTKRKGK